jgi:hypothetical protein
VITADDARKKAKELLGAVAKGNNPAHELLPVSKTPS